jgi:hypothetical protein
VSSFVVIASKQIRVCRTIHKPAAGIVRAAIRHREKKLKKPKLIRLGGLFARSRERAPHVLAVLPQKGDNRG